MSLILSSFLFVTDEIAFPGWVALLPTSGTGLLLYSICDGRSLLSKLFETSAFTGIGKISYSLYLWHWPSIIIGKLYADFHDWEPLSGAIVGAIIGGGLGVLAYRLLECPFRKRGKRRIHRLAIIGVLFACAFSLCFMAKRNVRADRFQFDPIVTLGYIYDDFSDVMDKFRNAIIKKDKNGNEIFFFDFGSQRDLVFLFHRRESIRSGIFKFYSEKEHPAVVVLGSSHALMYSKLIDDICREQKISVGILGGTAIPAFPTAGENSRWLKETLSKSTLRMKMMMGYFTKNQPDLLFLIDRWDYYDVEVLESNLIAFLGSLSALSIKVIFVAQVPVSRIKETQNFRKVANFLADDSGRLPAIFPDRYERRRREILECVQKIGKKRPQQFSVIRPDQLFYKLDGSIRYAEGKIFYYGDDSDLCDVGAELTRPVFERILLNLSKGQVINQPKP